MFLQGNLPLEFKESGTLLRRFWRRIWSWENCFWLEDLKKEEKKKGERRIFLLGTDLGLWGRRYICEKRNSEGGWFFRGILGWSLRKSTQEREKGDCSQDCPGTLLVTLDVFIHIQSLHLVVSENSMYCWLVWTKRATICFDDIGCLFVCLKPVVIFPTSLSPSKNHEMWLYRLSSIFIIFILWCLLVLSSFFSVLDHSSKFPGDCL